MAKFTFSRRKFLELSAVSGSAWMLSSCASVDSFFMGDSKYFKDEVLILGGGAAGLAAAFELKKKKVPYRLFEASSRIGGRVQSVQSLGSEGPISELGAEFVDISHGEVFSLAKELNLNLRQLNSRNVETQLFHLTGKNYRSKELQNLMKPLQAILKKLRTEVFRDQDVTLSFTNAAQFERAPHYDKMSLRDLLDSWRGQVDQALIKLIEIQAVNRFGVEAHEQSSLHFLSTLDADGTSLLATGMPHRMDGGLSNFTQTLAARVSGVIPEHLVKMNSALVEISESYGIFKCIFDTPRGQETYRCHRIICALPLSKLREVKGIQDLNFSDQKKELLFTQDYASHAKGLLGFTQPFWRQARGNVPANLGNFTGDFKTQKFWDSGRIDRDNIKNPVGALTFQTAGKIGAEAGAGTPQQALKDLALFYKNLPPLTNSEVVNWKNRQWSKGSKAYFRPGQFLRLSGIGELPEYDGRFQFAGEHTSLKYAGTLQGALESARRVVAALS